MKRPLISCESFDRSPQPFGILRVLLDKDSQPYDIVYEYINDAMGNLTGQKPHELIGKTIYEVWPYGDKSWIDYFYLAAYHNTPQEFEMVSAEYAQFQHCTVIPLDTGYCGLFLQEVTKWVSAAQRSMEYASSGIFFYDTSSGAITLTPELKDYYDLDSTYMSGEEFVYKIFGSEASEKVLEKFRGYSLDSDNPILYEAKLEDGRWIQISIGHTGGLDRFACGFVRDITRVKRAEESSKHRMEIIDSLSHENFALFLVDLDADQIDLYRMRENIASPITSQNGTSMEYSKFIKLYIDEYVSENDRERLYDALSLDSVLDMLESSEEDFSVIYKRKFSIDEQYVELRIIPLKRASHKIVMAARNINEEVRKQMSQKAALQDALELAKHASNAKSTFLTNMSHDFRTPMNSITGFAEIALDNLDNTDKVHDCLSKIITSSEHLLELINDILDVSRVESGKMLLSNDVVDLKKFLEEIEDVFSGQAADKGINFVVDIDGVNDTYVLSDKLRLNQILMNTIGNAFKFTDSGGNIWVSVTEDSSLENNYHMYTFRVRDTGCGMSQDFKEKIFLPFERDGINAMSNTEGTGLGMTITNNLVKLFGGNITVETELGKGTEFTIYLPLKLIEPEKATHSIDPATNEISYSIFEGKRALVIDDDDLSREVMSEILKKHGFIIEEGMDGYEAVQMVSESEEGHYDIIIMDMRMPKMNGDEACKLIRAMDRPDVASMPIIAATADALEEGHRLARESGMTAHTTKPINKRELLRLIADCLSKKI